MTTGHNTSLKTDWDSMVGEVPREHEKFGRDCFFNGALHVIFCLAEAIPRIQADPRMLELFYQWHSEIGDALNMPHDPKCLKVVK